MLDGKSGFALMGRVGLCVGWEEWDYELDGKSGIMRWMGKSGLGGLLSLNAGWVRLAGRGPPSMMPLSIHSSPRVGCLHLFTHPLHPPSSPRSS